MTQKDPKKVRTKILFVCRDNAAVAKVGEVVAKWRTDSIDALTEPQPCGYWYRPTNIRPIQVTSVCQGQLLLSEVQSTSLDINKLLRQYQDPPPELLSLRKQYDEILEEFYSRNE